MSAKTKDFPKLALPVPLPLPPMEASKTDAIPKGDQYQYEPKWDGFRAIIYRDRKRVVIQSKSSVSLNRYFPELVAEVLKIKAQAFVLDGEIVLKIKKKISFDDLQQRLHPAESRILRLSKETPVDFHCFDLLALGKKSLLEQKLAIRRLALEKFFEKVPESSRLELSPMTLDYKKAKQWFTQFASLGLDGIMVKDRAEPYHSGDRKAMIKVKHLKSADCVVGGYRINAEGTAISAILLGLYDDAGKLNHVGSCSSFNATEKVELLKRLKKLKGGKGFTGEAPGKSRWSKDENEFVPIKASVVVEVQYDYFDQRRFRHGTGFLRWRKDKKPALCTYEQLLT